METKKVRNNGKVSQVQELRLRADALEQAANAVYDGCKARLNREWLDRVPKIQGRNDRVPVVVELELSHDSLANLVKIIGNTGKTVDEVLSACINHGKDIMDFSNEADNPAMLAEMGL